VQIPLLLKADIHSILRNLTTVTWPTYVGYYCKLRSRPKYRALYFLKPETVSAALNTTQVKYRVPGKAGVEIDHDLREHATRTPDLFE